MYGSKAVKDPATENLADRLDGVADRASRWLADRRNPHGAGFGLCENALVPVELNATTGGIELWIMLGLPLTRLERQSWSDHLAGFQEPRSGLVVDPTWHGRQTVVDDSLRVDGDSFFTMTSVAALEALGGQLPYPVAYVASVSPDELGSLIAWDWIAHSPYGVGDFGPLVRHNAKLGVPGADRQWRRLNQILVERQGVAGFWPEGETEPPYTPHINRAFHVLRASWNLNGQRIERAGRLIDACLEAAGDPDFYSWDTGYACNDLDLAHVAYSASQWTDHRSEEVSEWAREALEISLAVEKVGGGFSFNHETAMEVHGGIRMSPGLAEADIWGTLMYLGTIKMLVELGWPTVTAPWRFSKVHALPSRGRR